MKKIFATTVNLFFAGVCLAQFNYPKQEDALALKKRILIVELFEEVSPVEKLTNETLKQAFKNNWIFSPVEFKLPSEIERIDPAKKSQYALLKHENDKTAIKSVERDEKAWQRPRPSTVGGVTYHDPGVSYEKVKNGKSYSRTIATLNSYELNLYLLGAEKPKKAFSVGFAHYFLNELDYLFAIQQMQNHLNSASKGVTSKDFFNVEKNLAELQKKTLLLEKEHLKFKENAIGYKYPYKVVPQDEYKALILKKGADYAYPKLIWSDQHQAYAFVAVDAATGNVLSLVTMGGVNKTNFGEHRPAYELDNIHLKTFPSKLGNNVNNKYK